MPSLADIPAHLIAPERRLEFLRWILQYPLEWEHTRATIRIWLAATGIHLSAEDWTEIETQHQDRYATSRR